MSEEVDRNHGVPFGNANDDDEDDAPVMPSSYRRQQGMSSSSTPQNGAPEDDDDDDDDDEDEDEGEEDDDEDEDEEEDDEEEEEDDEDEPDVGNKRQRGGQSASKNKRHKHSRHLQRYVEGEASEDEEEDEEDYGQNLPAAEAEGSDRNKQAYERIRREYDERKKSALETKEAKDIAGYFSQRAKEVRYREPEVEGQEGAGLMDYSSVVPGVEDPKLWMVKCKDGKETTILSAIMNKFIAKATAGTPLGIFSVVCPAKGTLFVEAYREQQVQEAIHGIQNVYGFRPNSIQRIPIEEMTSVLNVERKKQPIKKNQWVRMNRPSHFKDDVARVVDVLGGGGKVVVQLIPRIDIGKLSLSKEQREARTRATRPPQRFFNRDEIMTASNNTAQIESRRGPMNMRYEYWDRGFYRNGFLYREVPRGWVDPNGAPPTVDELAKFSTQVNASNSDNEDADDLNAVRKSYGEALRRSRGNTSRLAPEDVVVITKGDLRGIEGRVLHLKPAENTFVMQVSPDMARELGIGQKLEVPLDEATKSFEKGEHVKIVGGAHAGNTGHVTVIRPGEEGKSPTATVYLDTTNGLVNVFVNDLQSTPEVATAASAVAGYQLYDLVELPPTGGQKQSGVIVGIHQSELTLLTVYGQTKSVTLQQIRGKLNKQSQQDEAMDQQDRPIKVGDSIKVVSGNHRGMDGTVKHVARSFLFVHTYKRSENAGMLAVRANNTLLVGVQGRNGAYWQNNSFASQAPPYARGNQSGGQTAQGSGNRRQGVEDEYRGWSVQIRKGPNRGKIGMVKMTAGQQCTVELHSGQKKVKVNKKDLLKIGDRSGSKESFSSGGQSGVSNSGAPSQTSGMPYAGGNTPMPNPEGTYSGGATPSVPYGGSTPVYDTSTPAYGASSPVYGRTPGYEVPEGAGTPIHNPAQDE